MKKIRKILLVALMIFAVGGCSCSSDKCECPPNDPTLNDGDYTTINNGYRDLYKQTVQSVVMVRLQRKSNGEVKATGSGVVVMEEGESAYVITNAHVIKDLTNDLEIEIFFSDENGFMSGQSEIANLMGKDFNEDVAILEINKSTKYKVATLGDSSKVEKGDFVYTIGSPYQKFNHTTSGVISNYNTKINIDMSNSGVTTSVYAILFDAPINSGNSGGALFDSEGKVIGITTLKYDELDGMYGALPINYFMKVAKYVLVNNTNYVRPVLDLTLLSINEMGTLRETYGIAESITTGVFVPPQTILEENITPPTIITELNGVEIHDVAQLQVELLKYNVGDTVTLTLLNTNGVGSKTVSIVLHG